MRALLARAVDWTAWRFNGLATTAWILARNVTLAGTALARRIGGEGWRP